MKSYTDWMKTRVDSEYGKNAYSHRMSVVEPVFVNIGTNKRLNRFSLRGKTKVQAQWPPTAPAKGGIQAFLSHRNYLIWFITLKNG